MGALMVPVCRSCDSEEILAVAKWDLDGQKWDFVDCKVYCHQCDDQSRLKWAKLTDKNVVTLASKHQSKRH